MSEVEREETGQDTQDTQEYSVPDSQTFDGCIFATLLPSSPKDGTLPKCDLSLSKTTLGRDKKCDIVLPFPQLSSFHCEIIYEKGEVYLRDTSRNGTWINRERIRGTKVMLPDKAEIMLLPSSKSSKRQKVGYLIQYMNTGELKLSGGKARNACEEKYHTVKTLGSGAFATVYLGRHRLQNIDVAIKLINKKSWEKMKHATKRKVSLLDEVEIMRKISHDNIVRVHEYFEESERVFVVMDYCHGGDMLEYIQDHGQYSDADAKRVFYQLVNAIEYMHTINIAHRDLKPDNILLVDDQSQIVKISDFGISRESRSSWKCNTIIGTPMYQAPEVQKLRSRHPDGYDGKIADYWSLGIILYIMLVAAPPATDADETLELLKRKKLRWYGENVDANAKDLIFRLLSIDPLKRIGAKDIYTHPWMAPYVASVAPKPTPTLTPTPKAQQPSVPLIKEDSSTLENTHSTANNKTEEKDTSEVISNSNDDDAIKNNIETMTTTTATETTTASTTAVTNGQTMNSNKRNPRKHKLDETEMDISEMPPSKRQRISLNNESHSVRNQSK